MSQLDKIDFFKARRREIVDFYNKELSSLPEIIIQKEIAESDTCRHLYIIQLKLDALNCTRRDFFDAMVAENVQPQVHYVPVYWFPYYKELGFQKGLCPKAESLYEGMMSIPLYPLMTDQDMQDVVNAIKKIVDAYRK